MWVPGGFAFESATNSGERHSFAPTKPFRERGEGEGGVSFLLCPAARTYLVSVHSNTRFLSFALHYSALETVTGFCERAPTLPGS